MRCARIESALDLLVASSRERSAAEECRDLLGVDLVVLDRGAVDGSHVEGVAEDELDAFGLAEISEPVPGEDALGADDEAVAVGRDGFQERLGTGGEIPVEDDLAFVRK